MFSLLIVEKTALFVVETELADFCALSYFDYICTCCMFTRISIDAGLCVRLLAWLNSVIQVFYFNDEFKLCLSISSYYKLNKYRVLCKIMLFLVFQRSKFYSIFSQFKFNTISFLEFTMSSYNFSLEIKYLPQRMSYRIKFCSERGIPGSVNVSMEIIQDLIILYHKTYP